MNRRTFAILALLASLPAAAHTGVGPHAHGGFESGFTHPFLGLDHLLAMVAVGLWAARTKGLAVSWAPLAFMGGMLAGGMFGIVSEMIPPFVEVGVVGSAIALGVLVVVGLSPLSVPALVAIAIFGAFHGLAHGLEMPAEASASLYAAGFLAATALLHAAGAALGRLAKLKQAQAPLAGR